MSGIAAWAVILLVLLCGLWAIEEAKAEPVHTVSQGCIKVAC